MQKHYVIIADRHYTNADGGDCTYIQQYVGTNKFAAGRHLKLYKDTPIDANTVYWVSYFYNYEGKTLSQNMIEQCTDGKKPRNAIHFNIRMIGIDSIV